MKFAVLQVLLMSAVSQAQFPGNIKPVNFLAQARAELGIDQEPKKVWTYVKDVHWNGLAYEMYQTQRQNTDALESPEEIARKRREQQDRDTALVPKKKANESLTWKEALDASGLFELGAAIGYRNIASRAEIAASGRDALNEEIELGLVDAKLGPWTEGVGASRGGTTGQFLMVFRLPFYRLMRLSTYIEGVHPSGPEQRGTESNAAEPVLNKKPHFGFAAEHDIWIIPGKSSYVSFAAGVYAATNYYGHSYFQNYIAKEPDTSKSSVLNSATGRWEYPTKDVPKSNSHFIGYSYNSTGEPLNTSGYTLGVRKVWLSRDRNGFGSPTLRNGFSYIVELKAQFNNKGAVGALLQLKIGVLGRKQMQK